MLLITLFYCTHAPDGESQSRQYGLVPLIVTRKDTQEPATFLFLVLVSITFYVHASIIS